MLVHRDLNLFIVADGMGGHKGGEIASQMAIQSIAEYFQSNLPKFTSDMQENELCRFIANSICKANTDIYTKGKKDKDLEGMGPTVVQLIFNKDKLYIGNLGDSRAYLVHQQMIYQLTRDHSLIQEKLSQGIYTRAQALQDTHKNVLSKTCGFHSAVNPDVFVYKVKKNDCFVICSDGLSGLIGDDQMLQIIMKHLPAIELSPTEKEMPINTIAKELVSAANKNGGLDNISVVVALAS